MSGKAVQVIQNENGQPMNLNRSVLEKILMTDEIKDRFVSVISIAGAFRKGKSFILNFFLRYTNAMYVKFDVSNWLKNEKDNNKPLDGFSWRLGTERETTGILMWSDVFLYDYENGDKVAIILLDTQGTFDHQSTVRECASIFALSTMVSSVQIYNLTTQIQENDLQDLEFFVNYGKMALEKCKIKPFQRLVFLVRDWSCSYEYAYGEKGGSNYLKKVLKVEDTQPAQLQSVRKNINECFMETKCFLMPHPGLKVASDPNFVGNLDVIEKDFQDSLLELIPSILSPKNIIIKKMNGQNVRAKEWIEYFNRYTEVFNGDTLPEPKSIFMATADVHNITISSEAKSEYTNLMELNCGKAIPYITEKDLEEHHLKAKAEVLTNFESKPKLGEEAMIIKYRTEVELYINNHYENIKSLNKSKLMEQKEKLTNLVDTCKQMYLKQMKANCKEYSTNLINLHKQAKNMISDQFNLKSKFDHKSLVDSYRKKLLHYVDEEYENLKKLNEGNKNKLEIANLKAVDEAKAFYNHQMENACKLYTKDIEEKQTEIRNEALSRFNKTPNLGNEQFKKTYYDQLNAYIQSQYKKFSNLNNEKYNHILNNIKGDCIQMELSYVNSMNSKLQQLNLTDNEIESIHNTTMNSILTEFKSKWQRDHSELFRENVSELKSKLEKKYENIKSAYIESRNKANSNTAGKAVASVGKFTGAVAGGTTGTVAGAVSGLGTGVVSGFSNGMSKIYEESTSKFGNGFWGNAIGIVGGLTGGLGAAVVGGVVGTGTGVVQGFNKGVECGVNVVDNFTNDDVSTNIVGGVFGTAGSMLTGIGAGIVEGSSTTNNMINCMFEDKYCDDLDKQFEKTKKAVDSI